MKRLRYLEIAAWIVGLALLTIYGGARWWYAYSYDEALNSFADARRAPRNSGMEEARAALQSVAFPVDLSTWSLQRIERYHAALKEAKRAEGVLRIPALKLVVPVFEGTSEANLNRGAGRIEGTTRIGDTGNVGIAAHRDGFFRVLKDIRIGDALYLDRIAATEEYRVIATHIVDPSDVSVLDKTPKPSVTLVTCYPFYFVGSAPQRFIVQAQLVSPRDGVPGSS